MFYSLLAFKHVRKHTIFSKADNFYGTFFQPMNAEFYYSTLRETIEENRINIECKFKDCPFKLSFKFDLNEDEEMIYIRSEKTANFYHCMKSHQAREIKRPTEPTFELKNEELDYVEPNQYE